LTGQIICRQISAEPKAPLETAVTPKKVNEEAKETAGTPAAASAAKRKKKVDAGADEGVDDDEDQ